MKNKSNIIRFLSIIFKKNKKVSTIAFFIMIISATLNLLIPQITIKILDEAIPHKDNNLLIKLIIIYIIISVINPLFEIITEYIYSRIKKKIGITLRLDILNQISKLSGNYYSNLKTGNILRIVDNDVNMLESFGIDLIFSLLIDIGTAIVALYFLIQMQFDLLLIVLFLQVIIIIIQTRFTIIIASKLNELRQNAGEISNIVQEYISNIMNAVISKSISYFFKNYINKEKELIKKSIFLDILYSGNSSVGLILTSFITIAIYGYGGFKIIRGGMSIGELIAFQQYTWMLIGPCIRIIKSNTRIQQSLVSINRIFEIIDEPIDIKQDNKAKVITRGDCSNIVFNKVNFSYNGDRVLDGISMLFKKGETTALVGSSGCGKSTIVNLLYRLWDVDSGNIMIDNQDIKEYNLKSVRRNISIITQDLLLFNDSIQNNLVLDNKDMDINQIENICKKVGIYQFIKELPDAFDTMVGERGVKLSGGQKQRIAIARAILCSSKIIIMDEATSALDNISQKCILDNLNDYLKDKITIVIAHRLTTVRNADKIYVIKNGRIEEEGSHNELISNKGVYFNLSNEQLVN